MKKDLRSFSLLLLSVFVSLGLAKAATDANGCPMDLPNTSEMAYFEPFCYQFVHEEKFWHQARDYCLRYQGRLVKIDDPETNDFIVGRLRSLHWQNRGVWIGLHDITSELHWEWTGFQLHQNEPMRWSNWGRGHPKAFLHSLRDCVRMVREDGWKWHETFCNSMRWHYRFICEYSANVSSVNGRRGDSSVNRQHHPIETANLMQNLGSESIPGESKPQSAAAAVVKTDEEIATNGAGARKSATIPIAITCLLVGALALVVLFVLFRRRRRQSEEIREYSDENYVRSKGKEFDDVTTAEVTSPFRPSAVSNLYVDADTKGHVTSRLSAKPENHLSDSENDVSGYGKDGYAKDAVKIRSGGGSVEGCYSAPSDVNVYSEILDGYGAVAENGHIYEAIENVKK